MKYEIPENATILSINGNAYDNSYDNINMEGLFINTDKGHIKLMISNRQSCCEGFGSLFFETPDDISKFVGSRLIEIKTINVPNDSYLEYDLNQGDETQLKITTSKGVLQYAVYNSHNGYYAHCSILQVFDSIEETYL